MSNYDDASLIMFPSGYKEDKIYSLKPTDGSGDLTFTRASTATRVNADGLIETSPVNLLSYSEQFDNGAWTKINATITSNSIAAPNGTTTADLITSTGTSETGLYIITSFIGTNTWSVYAKKGTGRYLFFNTNSPLIAAKFDLQDGIIVGTPSVGATPSIENVGDGWYRCIITSSTAENRFTVFITNNTTTSDLTSSVGLTYYLWGAQLNSGATAKPYFPTTDRLDVPRIDYTGGGCGKLLLEPQRSNVCLWSEQIDNAGWTKTSAPTITTNIATAPDGYGGADGIQDTTGGAFKRIRQSTSVSANSTNTASVFVKKETTQTNFGGFALTYTGGTTKYAYGIVNPITGTIVVSTDSNISSSSTKVEDFGDWWRFSLTATDNGSNTAVEIAYYGTLSTNGTSAGTGAGSVRTIWGFQLEIAATYATSYIPTLASSVTRLADTAFKTGISSLINSTEGVLYLEGSALINGGSNRVISLYESSSSRVSITFHSIANRIQFYVAINGYTNTVNIDTTTIDQTNLNKIAVRYGVNNYALFINGTKVAEDTTQSNTFSVNSLSKLTFSDVDNFYGNVQNLMIFPSALSDTELATLTTL